MRVEDCHVATLLAMTWWRLPTKKASPFGKALNNINSKLKIRYPKLRDHLPADDVQRAACFKPLYLLCIIGVVYREAFCCTICMV